MRKLCIGLTFLYWLNLGWANPGYQAHLDSLLTVLDHKKPDTSSLDYFELMNQIAVAHSFLEDYQRVINTCRKANQNPEILQFPKLSFKLKLTEGAALYHISEFKKAIEVYISALKTNADFITANDSSIMYRHLGDIHYYLGNLKESYQYHLQAKKIYEASGKPGIIGQFYYAEGLIFLQQNKFPEALKSYKKSLKLIREGGDTSTISDLYSVIGDVYFELDSLDLALKYQQIAFEKDSLKNYNYGMGYGYFSLGKTHAQLGNLEYAMTLHQKGRAIRNKLGDKEEEAESLAEIGLLSGNLGNHSIAEKQLKTALKIALTIEAKPLVQKIYKYLSENSLTASQYKNAFEYQRRYFLLKDSLINEKSLKNIDELKSKYQLEQKEQEIALLQKSRQLNQLYWQLAGFGLLLLIGAFFAGKKMYDKQIKYNKALTKMNREIKAQNVKLERANEDLEQFAYISSHDLKAPLRTVGSYANLLQRRYKSAFDQDGREFLDFILSGVKHMNVLLEDIYNYTRLDKTPDIVEVVDLEEVVSRVVFQLDNLLKSTGTTIEVEPLPKVYGSTTFLGQVFQNLIQNGIKFTAEGVQPKIHIESVEKSNHIQIKITDNGIGIAEEFQSKIFTIFRRLHTSESYSGTGVGLAICKKIIERHGGRIWVESDGKNGSCFYFTLKPFHEIRSTESVKKETGFVKTKLKTLKRELEKV